jgi:hypothetical protein
MVGKIVAVPGKTCFLAAIHSKPSFTGLAGIFYSFIKLCYLTDNNLGILRILGVLSDIDLLNEANCRLASSDWSEQVARGACARRQVRV